MTPLISRKFQNQIFLTNLIIFIFRNERRYAALFVNMNNGDGNNNDRNHDDDDNVRLS